ncbi:hypothetical protein QFZ23_004362 [Arthrobacter globiformis]|uniref:hypothetical protein n=1 Tax=Arthrobacter globiformis TaxID=1665 RepID=UPI00278B7924|nr:hypothetical protein [Arthrobacter globiformis]MDQ1060461.1 hypothetical protein [Arthrobacter globiformis]
MTPDELARRSAEIAESSAHAAWWSAAGSIGTAALTLGLLVGAIAAWHTAKESLKQARAAQLQIKLDSIEQTRPFVFARIVPGIGGVSTWDLVVSNSGKSSAEDLIIDTDDWPENDDLIVTALKRMFSTKQTLPPGVSLRSFWRIDPTPGSRRSDGGPDVDGMPRTATLKLTYTSQDPTKPLYNDTYVISNENIGLTPVASKGPDPSSRLSDGEASLHKMLGRIVQSIGELRR